MMVVGIVLGCDVAGHSLNSTVIVVDNAGGCRRSFALIRFGLSWFAEEVESVVKLVVFRLCKGHSCLP